MEISVPGLNWFEANPWDKVGNKYTGSIGADSIHNNAFLYILNYYRYDDKDPELVAEVYDCKMKMSGEEPEKKSFAGTKEGRTEMIEWLEQKYEEHVSSGKSAEKILY